MNPEPALATLEPEVVDQSPATAAKEKEEKCGKGNVAGLPKVLRDQVNTMLDDGVPYRLIIKKLNESTDPPLPWPISEVNISRWKNNGYQKYLLHQDLRADIRFIRESATDFSELNQEHQFQNTLIQLGLTDIYRELTDPTTRTDPLKHIRILNALARLNREALNLRKYNDLRADNVAASQPIGATRAPTAEEICNSFLTGFETVTGIKPADGPIGPDINHILDPAQPARSSRGNEPIPPRSQTSSSTLSETLSNTACPPDSAASPAAPNPASAGEGDCQFKVESSEFDAESAKSRSLGIRCSPSGIPLTGPVAPTCRAEASGRRRKSDEGGSALAAPERSGDGSAPALRSARDEGGSVPSDKSSQASPPPVPRDPHPAVTPLSSDQSKIENRKLKMHAPPLTDPLTHLPTRPVASQPSTPQPSTTPAPELCYACNAPLPPLKPNGTRPSPSCPGCQIRLHPPGTTYDHCPSCNAFQAISTSGERLSKECDHCHQVLPPVGHRYTAECPSCGLGLNNFTHDGTRVIERCPDCRTLLPLHEPIPPAAPKSDEGVCTNQSTSPLQRQSEPEAGPLTNSLTGSPTDSLPPAFANAA